MHLKFPSQEKKKQMEEDKREKGREIEKHMPDATYGRCNPTRHRSGKQHFEAL